MRLKIRSVAFESLIRPSNIVKIADYLGFSETTFYELRCRDLTVYGAYRRGYFAYKNNFRPI